MRLAIQEGLLPGRDLAEKAHRAKEYGYDGVELWGSATFGERMAEIRSALGSAGVSAACVCAGYRGALLAREARDRETALADIEALLGYAGELGATGVIVVPVFGGAQVPDLRPWKDAQALERELLAAQLPRLNEAAAKAGCHVLIEPLNRYETHFVRTVADSAAYCASLSHVAVMADFFHMSIEEGNIAAAITANAAHIRHVHLADSNRQLPGHGHTDFLPGFRALAAAGFSGFMSLECGVPGRAEDLLPRCASHLRDLVSRAHA